MSSWVVPGYADTRELGQTPTGRTVVATHAATGVDVAIRYLADDLHHDEVYLNRYRAAVRLLVDLDSPHVAATYEYVEADHGVATVRQFVNGTSLRVLIVSHGAMSPEAALSVLKGGLLALRAGHAVGAVHGGYTPDNVLVDLEGHTKISDFGRAAALGSAAADMAAAVATFITCLAGTGRAEPSSTLCPNGYADFCRPSRRETAPNSWLVWTPWPPGRTAMVGKTAAGGDWPGGQSDTPGRSRPRAPYTTVTR